MKNKISVLHIITGLDNGGAENMLARLIEAALDPSSHAVVSMMDEGALGGRIRRSGASVYALNMSRGSFLSAAPLGLFNIIRCLKPDAIQCWMYHANLFGGMVAKFAGMKNVFWGIRQSSLLTGVKKQTLLVNKICAMSDSFLCKKTICCGISAVEECRKAGYSPDRLVYIPNGYRSGDLYPSHQEGAEFRKKLSIPENALVFGHAGRLAPAKNHGGLIRSFAMAFGSRPDVFLIMAGSGVRENVELNELVGLLGLSGRIIAVGDRKNDMRAFYNSIDALAVSSFEEGFPNVIPEAMLCGKPCVSTDAGDARYIIEDCEFISPAGDDRALADNMRKLGSMGGAERAELGEKFRRRIMVNYDINSIYGKYAQIWGGRYEGFDFCHNGKYHIGL